MDINIPANISNMSEADKRELKHFIESEEQKASIQESELLPSSIHALCCRSLSERANLSLCLFSNPYPHRQVLQEVHPLQDLIGKARP